MSRIEYEHVMTAKDQDVAHELKNEFLDLCLKRKINALVALAAARCAAECFESIINEQGGEVFTVATAPSETSARCGESPLCGAVVSVAVPGSYCTRLKDHNGSHSEGAYEKPATPANPVAQPGFLADRKQAYDTATKEREARWAESGVAQVEKNYKDLAAANRWALGEIERLTREVEREHKDHQLTIDTFRQQERIWQQKNEEVAATARADTIREAIERIKAERLHENLDNESDKGYQRAINHMIAALEQLKQEGTNGTAKETKED